jgi:osmotically-inducible protein OsmY
MTRVATSLKTVTLILAGLLSGCATYEKCGIRGCPGDAEITAGIQALIRQHPALEAPNSVRVQTLDHVVYLYGQVNTELERSDAEELAHQVAGVTRVVNSIHFSYEGM